MSYSDDGWGSDSDDVKVAEEEKVDTEIRNVNAPALPIQEIVQSHVEVPKPQLKPSVGITEKPTQVNSDCSISLNCDSDDGWGEDTPVKKFEKTVHDKPNSPRALVSPSPTKSTLEIVDVNDTYDATLDFSQMDEMPSPTAERNFDLPPKAERSNAEGRQTGIEKCEFVKKHSGASSLKPSGFGGNAKHSKFGGDTKPSGFGGDTKSTGFGGDTKPSGFGGDTKSTGFGGETKSPGFGGETKSPGFGDNSKPSRFGGDSNGAKPTFGRQQPLSAVTNVPAGEAFGENNASTKPSGFGAPQQHSAFDGGAVSTWGSSKPSRIEQSSGFGGVSATSTMTGFGNAEKPVNGWGGTESKSSGFGQFENREPGFGGGSISGKMSGFGSSESKPSVFGQSENKQSGFSGGSLSGKQSGFGTTEKSSSGWDSSQSKSTGFGQSESKKSGFGGGSAPGKQSGFGTTEKSSSGWDSSQSKSTGFGQSEGKQSGFGGGSASEKQSGFGQSESKQSGFDRGSARLKPTGFGTSEEKQSSGWDNSGSKLSGLGKTSGFGEKSSGGWGESKPKALGFGEKEKSAFGSSSETSSFGTSEAGFGTSRSSSKQSAFGEPKSGFGTTQKPDIWSQSESQQTGFPQKSTTKSFGGNSAFGEKSSTFSQGFGGNAKTDGFGSSSSGFGKSSASGFSDAPRQSAFGTETGFGASKSSFGKPSGAAFGSSSGGIGSFGHNDGGFGRPERKRGCFNCGSEDHRKDECPESPKPSTCRNCGEEGHFSKDCEKERVPTGPCRNCQQVGHFAKDCTNERVMVDPTEPCRRCGEEGHWAFDCPTRPRDMEGNLLVPYDVQFVPETDLFNEAVDNDSRIDFDQKVFASIGNASIPDYASFDEFKMLAPALTNNLRRMKMNRPTPIQRASFFPILNGNDVVACAHTGSGKTLAFLIPFATKLIDDMANNDGVRDEKPSPSLLIVSPTRELASQTFNTARQLSYETGLKCGIAYGGYSRSSNLQHLRSFDQLNILVATMGRLQDFLESKDISLDKLKYIVLDEADRMVDGSDFGLEVSNIIGNPADRSAQTVLFSASFSENLQREDLPKFVKENYTMLQVDKFGTANEKIEQTILPVPRTEKRRELCNVLGLDENSLSLLPNARIESEKTIIFVNSVKFCDSLASFLCNSGVQTVSMHSHQNQEIRDRILDEFRRGKYMCMVASNVAARGLNISGLDHVINYDMPDINGFDEYVNRIGRTGRAGFTGTATAFVDEESDREIIPSLVNVLVEAKKEVPEWLSQLNDQANNVNEDNEEEEW